uniref:Hydantoinase/oxoprolinase family protein n=1 Tax=Archaeoglobus fulgidus TaxID=2234 RepID=A0A7J2TLJ0_ARCFL
MIGINIGGASVVCAMLEDEIKILKKPAEIGLEAIANEIKDISKHKAIVSTSLPMNHILMKYEKLKTLVLLIPGPGLNYCSYGYILKGYVNHRGDVVERIDEKEVRKILEIPGYSNVAIASKFSVRNPILEEEVKKIVLEKFEEKKIALSNFVGGLNYPARINTTIINAKLKEMIWNLTDEVKKFIPNFYYLTSDGSISMPNIVIENPSLLYNSSSVASAFGAMFLTGIKDCVVVDIGGHSTNLIPIENGKPRFVDFLEIMGKRTLVRSVEAIVIPFGGNSVISEGRLTEELCKPIAFGGEKFTLTDAINCIGQEIGDFKASRSFEEKVDYDVAVQQFVSLVAENLKELDAKMIVGSGYLAPFIIPEIAKKAKISYVIPKFYDGVRAIGSAVSRISLTLHARFDTEKGVAIYNGCFERAPFRIGSLPKDDEIIEAARKKMIEIAKSLGAEEEIEDIKVLDFYSFTIVKGGIKRGLIADVTMQIEPGVRRWKKL